MQLFTNYIKQFTNTLILSVKIEVSEKCLKPSCSVIFSRIGILWQMICVSIPTALIYLSFLFRQTINYLQNGIMLSAGTHEVDRKTVKIICGTLGRKHKPFSHQQSVHGVSNKGECQRTEQIRVAVLIVIQSHSNHR